MEYSKLKLDRFLTMAQYPWRLELKGLQAYGLADSGHVMCPQFRSDISAIKGLNRQLASISAQPSCSQAVKKEEIVKCFKETVQAIKAAGMPFEYWADFCCSKRDTGRGYSVDDCHMLPELYEYLMQEVGDLFLGFEIGEWDGLYGRDVVSYWQEDDYPKDRRQAHDMLMSYLRGFHEKAYRNTNALCGLTFAHYFNELPVRMVGAEVAQGLLNTQVYISSLRGACRQYGMQYKLLCSIFDRWGYKSYMQDGELKTATGVKRVGPVQGHSIGLFWAQWLMGYFSEAAIVGVEGAFYREDENEYGLRKLSPIGEELAKFTEWSHDSLPRGSQLRPMALMMDYYAGWAPPRHLYSVHEYSVWHSIPYGLCDYGMDRIYDSFYPGYCDSGFYRDERGFITPTPNGDVIDFLLSDASQDVMDEYEIIWLVSDETPADELVKKLRAYAENGGHLIVSGQPMCDIAKQWFDVEVSNEKHHANHSVLAADDIEIREAYCSVRELNLDSSWSVELATDTQQPLIASIALGSGKVTFIAADHGLTDKLVAPGLDSDYERAFVPDPPYEMLNGVRRFVRAEVSSHLPVKLSHPGVYHSVNELDDGEFIVLVYNAGHDVWEGSIQMCDKCTVEEISGPWRDQPAMMNGLIKLETNESALFRISKF